VIALIFLASFLVLADDANQSNNRSDNKSVGPGAFKNMTFWQCVSDAAKYKNLCFKADLARTKICLNQSADSTAKRACQENGIQVKKECKTAFKTKKTDCRKLKHSWWDAFRASFK